jgi:hypothetical protein
VLGIVEREFGIPLPGFGWISRLRPGFLSIQIDDRGGVVFPAQTIAGRVALLRAGQHANN